MEEMNKYVLDVKKQQYTRASLDDFVIQECERQRSIIVAGWEAAQALIAKKDAKVAELSAPAQSMPVVQSMVKKSPGMQELDKHKVAFRAAFKKIYDISIQETDFAATGYSDYYDISLFQAREREIIRQKKETLKELEDAFNGLFVSRVEPQMGVIQKIEKPAALKKLWELANHDYVSDWAATDHSAIDKAFFSEKARQQALVYKEMATELEAAIDERDVLIAHLQAQDSPQQAMAAPEHQALAHTLSQVRAQLQKETITTYTLAADLAPSQEAQRKKENELIEMWRQLEEARSYLRSVQQRDSQASAQSQDFQKRMASLLALFEGSKTGWETLFVQAIREELK